MLVNVSFVVVESNIGYSVPKVSRVLMSRACGVG